MDTDKEKSNIPEKSQSFVSRNKEKDEKNEDYDQNSQITTAEAPELPDGAEGKQDDVAGEAKQDDVVTDPETEIKEGEQPTDVENQESSPLPPDLNKLSEEIDQYISNLSSLQRDDSNFPNVPIFIEHFAILVEAKIEDYDSSDSPVKWSKLSEQDSASFLDSLNRVSRLSSALSEFSSDYKYAYTINRIGGVLQRAISYIEEEFKSLLDDHKLSNLEHNNNDSKPKQSTSSNPNQDALEPDPVEETNSPAYSEENLSNLIRLSRAMILGGYESECRLVYFVARRNALEESLHKNGFEKHSIDDVQKMHWESLEREIVAWLKIFRQCSVVHFPSEQKLSDAIFSDYPSISECLISSLSINMVTQLLTFAKAVAMTKRAAEKLFKFLDIYEVLRDVVPTMESLLSPEIVDELKAETSLIRSWFAESMISIFGELENSIKADSGKTPVPGGAVHPLTRYTMNYLKYASEYKDSLEQVFREHQKIDRVESATGSDFEYNPEAQVQNSNNDQTVKQSPFQLQMMKVMDLLDANLDAKSKLYRDISLSSIFMMNNGRYILQKIKGSTEINSLMGDTWYRKRSSDLRQYHKCYQRETWGKLLSCLNPEGLSVNGKVVKPVLKEKFNSFNKMFDEIHRTQTCWVVSDEQLQSELRVSISNMVIPAYRSFLGRFSSIFTPGRQTEKYVKYQPEDIETNIDELFDGNAAPAGRRRI
ncbi:exocyst complex component EXO70B1-like [Olea europaea subsp. europaea]|uniref:Exocyst subunit Exo70 family protein n=1 Tax=Olea europaea subsp. europaea TaxID=158383 RepID=A0A8S0RUQ8_OLEEU|nr:exocyst complex component EXO70B1-like [Olea europaea subsp. europaea]